MAEYPRRPRHGGATRGHRATAQAALGGVGTAVWASAIQTPCRAPQVARAPVRSQQGGPAQGRTSGSALNAVTSEQGREHAARPCSPCTVAGVNGDPTMLATPVTGLADEGVLGALQCVAWQQVNAWSGRPLHLRHGVCHCQDALSARGHPWHSAPPIACLLSNRWGAGYIPELIRSGAHGPRGGRHQSPAAGGPSSRQMQKSTRVLERIIAMSMSISDR